MLVQGLNLSLFTADVKLQEPGLEAADFFPIMSLAVVRLQHNNIELGRFVRVFPLCNNAPSCLNVTL